jgi:hypothetical protein
MAPMTAAAAAGITIASSNGTVLSPMLITDTA